MPNIAGSAPILSRQNPFVKRTASLKQKKYRDEFSEYIVEGEKMVAEAIATGQDISSVVMIDGMETTVDIPEEKTVRVSENVFKAMSDEMTPQGILAVVKIPEKPSIGRLSRCLILDGLQDPGNVGAILRIAAACGIDHVFAVSCADPYSPKAVRSSMSGVFRTKIIKCTREKALAYVKDENVPLFVADMNGKNVFTAEKTDKFCFVLGNEGNGVSEFFKVSADETISIPMMNGIESLNVAVAAGVCVYSFVFGGAKTI